MTKISKQIRAYVDDPQSTGVNHYGEWGALRPSQRRLIRMLCDVCDVFEKEADEYHLVVTEIFNEIEKNLIFIRDADTDVIRGVVPIKAITIIRKNFESGVE